ncbi:acetyl-CoA/propionyl-CoA carboxylase, biotin carboxylase, biotin carboxyl carrier protein [Pseudonocardia ammonioxydans]|uniref:Acetyl-CoA/propionyl-CoA carboxylase, biotin carboxylase, biotin carboxyl carrier protein n=1 Tax=Pseudonocardia ammonioxydans TaxID=260086 RepID=A0A1I5BUY7_PSUAM|nr:biotin carboxylase N-terminal domain-containing protein [Pseudonocardia ammonioxydans]SFN78497.1 acetyl-CoA/propionyl-CoA carboxylase, biotin carboxylase, biotin carboxyl carrier protein [Pseudonocardia ammonioxydans]
MTLDGRTPGTVLVANRGEIAVRIVRACREAGLRPVAVYSDADAGAPHVALADEAHRIGPPPARDSYLDVEALLGAAKAAGADAVHPGYGLLSEDAGFAAAVTGAGMRFVGPSAEVIATMGDKVAARAIARECGVPVPEGTGTVDPDDPALPARAARLGYPLVVKASFGGGGRGMRVVTGPDELAEALAAAAREGAAAFGRSEVHLERYLPRPRHVEVQVLADDHGTVVALGDRDCSVQRRHQKLIEEAPAPGLSPQLRAALADAAVRITRRVGYSGAGTVEFLVSGTEFAFLEMNTRLQVEHGVTELVTGVDLVAEQLRVAGGESLSPTVLEVASAGAAAPGDPAAPGGPAAPGSTTVRGHAIQARIAVEDPRAGFRPSPGPIGALELPAGPGVRTDFGVVAGGTVPAEYDSMIGKVLAHAADRDTARRRLGLALDELVVGGRPTTAGYLRAVLDTAEFAAGTHDTGSVERDWAPEALLGPAGDAGAASPGPAAEPGAAGGSGTPGHAVPVRRVRIATDRGPLDLLVAGRAAPGPAGTAAPLRPTRSTDDRPAAGNAPGAAGDPTAPMDATVVTVRVAPGDAVAAGDVVVVLEAMKMEMEIRAGTAGTVAAVPVTAGSPIAAGAVLVELT